MKAGKPRVLLAWIGNADLQGAGVEEGPRAPRGPGSIAAALDELAFNEVVLLASWPAKKVDGYLTWLAEELVELAYRKQRTWRLAACFANLFDWAKPGGALRGRGVEGFLRTARYRATRRCGRHNPELSAASNNLISSSSRGWRPGCRRPATRTKARSVMWARSATRY